MEFEQTEDQLCHEEEQLRAEIASLPLEEKNLYYSLELERMKDHEIYNKLKCFFFIGLHHFYLEKWVRGSIDIILFAIGGWLLISGVSYSFGINSILAIFIFELPQFYTYSDAVHGYNNDLMKKLLHQLKY